MQAGRRIAIGNVGVVLNVQTRANDQPIQPAIRATGGFQQDAPGLATVKQQVVWPFITHFDVVGQQIGHCLPQRQRSYEAQLRCVAGRHLGANDNGTI